MDKLKLSRETLRLLSPKEAKSVQGGLIAPAPTKKPGCSYVPGGTK